MGAVVFQAALCVPVLSLSPSCLRLRNAVQVISLLLSKETPAGLLSVHVKFQDKAVAAQWNFIF